MNAYDKLGVARNATEEEVKKAYRELSQKYYTDSSTESPLKEQNEAKMQEINDAFDEIILQMRTGNASGTSYASDYENIRDMINTGNADAALSQLNAMGRLSSDPEWNFLMGSAYYYKGWVTQAEPFFETACNLSPSNAEYSAALANIRQSTAGNMYGSPYANSASPYGNSAAGCGPCDMCSALMCANLCCNCGRGGC